VSTDLAGAVALAHIGAEFDDVGSLYVHATGFCKELWIPVVRQVGDRIGTNGGSAMLVDQRGHGDSTPFEGPLLWDLVARDVLAAVADVRHPIVGVGHSGGGAAIARAEILSPGTFSTIVLFEPIVWPPPFEPKDKVLAANASRRRRTFGSQAEAKERFATGPFSGWDEEVLDLYVGHAFHESEEGWSLKCEPWVEAECYRQAGNVDTWDRLHEIDCRVVVMSGEHSDTNQDPYRTQLVDRFRDATSLVVEGVGHLAPMEAPTLIGDLIADAIGDRISDEAGGPAGGTIA
jgi:pimeloyl-ACP methyl ester carboxylesterase